jgi:predicted nucleic acid-binding protein
VRPIVTDASALIEYLLGTDAAAPVRGVVRRPDVDLHIPALCDVEVAAGLRRALLRSALAEQRAAAALHDYVDLPLVRHGHQSLLERILGLRANFSAYDATYVALAELLSADLLTADEKLAHAVAAHTNIRTTGDSGSLHGTDVQDE